MALCAKYAFSESGFQIPTPLPLCPHAPRHGGTKNKLSYLVFGKVAEHTPDHGRNVI